MFEGYRADELTYVEVSSPWARDGRAVVESKIFGTVDGTEGVLIATSVQEAYYILKDDEKESKL